jgi:hypothetical protein
MMNIYKVMLQALIVVAFLPASGALGSDSVTLHTESGDLFGTLEVPKGSAPFPVALIISGSGPTDRNGNNLITGQNNSLKLLAEAMASRGIASFRYDKRGIAESIMAGANEEDLRFEIYINDAVLWGRELRKNRRFSSLVVIGHSEGSLIGMVACHKLDADGFISIAGAGFPASHLILRQLKPMLPEDEFNRAKSIVERLKQGEIVKEVPATFNALFRLSVQPYLISWFNYDPARELAKLQVPALIIQGTTDIQITMANAKELAKSNSKSELLVIEGMNHILKEVPGNQQQQMNSYRDPHLPIAPELIDSIVTFTMTLEKNRPNKSIDSDKQ